MGKIYNFISECNVFFLGTVNDNKPEIRPFGAMMEYQNELYFSTGTTKQVYKQLCNNSNIQIVALKEGTRNWIRINGTAKEVYDFDIKQIMLDTCPILKKRFDDNKSSLFALFKISNINAIINLDNQIIKL